MKETVDEIVKQQQDFMKSQPTYDGFRAWTTYPNTPESDKEMFVMHTVKYEVNGRTKETEVNAADPMDAIDRVHEYLTNKD